MALRCFVSLKTLLFIVEDFLLRFVRLNAG